MLHRDLGLYNTATNFNSDRQAYNNSVTKNHKKAVAEEVHYGTQRDISPYRVENFIEMLHNFGISDATIKKKIITSPLGHVHYKHEPSIESQNEASTITRSVTLFTSNQFRRNQNSQPLSH